ncbi:hypothetical protein [Olivibacter sitiensis]|uniref:hypothetical protein n=1 Tax=Olivibacter sitiensis TaxID=376470 RepID=UPI001FE23B15|nr:hypothetical protein [Olivibacter sitiensis]
MPSFLHAQVDSIRHLDKLEIGRKKTEHIQVRNRDSSFTLSIDTLIMKDRATLSFLSAKKVTLKVKHAFIEGKAYITGTDNKNNGSHMDIYMGLDKLKSLYVLTAGRDANNGFKTFPNGNGGNVNFYYLQSAIEPQTDDEKADNYLRVDNRAGGYKVVPQRDLAIVYSQIAAGIRVGNGRLGSTPQGQIYSGSPGRDGKTEIKASSGF